MTLLFDLDELLAELEAENADPEAGELVGRDDSVPRVTVAELTGRKAG